MEEKHYLFKCIINNRYLWNAIVDEIANIHRTIFTNPSLVVRKTYRLTIPWVCNYNPSLFPYLITQFTNILASEKKSNKDRSDDERDQSQDIVSVLPVSIQDVTSLVSNINSSKYGVSISVKEWIDDWFTKWVMYQSKIKNDHLIGMLVKVNRLDLIKYLVENKLNQVQVSDITESLERIGTFHDQSHPYYDTLKYLINNNETGSLSTSTTPLRNNNIVLFKTQVSLQVLKKRNTTLQQQEPLFKFTKEELKYILERCSRETIELVFRDGEGELGYPTDQDQRESIIDYYNDKDELINYCNSKGGLILSEELLTGVNCFKIDILDWLDQNFKGMTIKSTPTILNIAKLNLMDGLEWAVGYFTSNTVLSSTWFELVDIGIENNNMDMIQRVLQVIRDKSLNTYHNPLITVLLTRKLKDTDKLKMLDWFTRDENNPGFHTHNPYSVIDFKSPIAIDIIRMLLNRYHYRQETSVLIYMAILQTYDNTALLDQLYLEYGEPILKMATPKSILVNGTCHINNVKWILNRIPQIQYSSSAIIQASTGNNLPVLQLLNDISGKLPELKTNHKAMDISASKGYLDIVKYLHFNRQEGCTKAALNNAAGNGHLQMITFLKENRSEGCSGVALNRAAEAGHLEVIKFLVKHYTNRVLIYTTAVSKAKENGYMFVYKELNQHIKNKKKIV